MAVLLKGTGLCKRYTDRSRQIDALRDVSFSLEEGMFLGIVGESGSGKSTLLRVIAGLEKPDSGQLFYREQQLQSMGPGERGRFLQMIFQDASSSFDPRMTMRRSILESGRGRNDEAVLRELAGLVGLDAALLDRKPALLSGGQCQRMSIIRALYSGVEILLCDEITSALDVSTQAQIVSIMKELRDRRGLSAIFVSHDIALVSVLCDTVMVMKDGSTIETGETAGLITGPREDYTRSLIESARRQTF